MSSIPFHLNLRLANRSVSWAGSDTYETYQKNLTDPGLAFQLEQLGWNERSITYQYNSYGMRDEEFDSRPCGLAFGCSFTEGTGLPNEDTWPRKLTQLSGLHFWNLGVGGASIATVYRLFEYYIELLSPKIVLLLEPPNGRLELAIGDNEFTVESPTVSIFKPEDHGLFLKYWHAYEINNHLYFKKNLQALQFVCLTKNIPFVHLPNSVLLYDMAARDLMHASASSQYTVAAQFWEKIQTLL